MKKVFLVALAAMSLVSCSNDEVLDLQKDEIKLNVVTQNASRANELYNANNLHKEFYVSAVYKENANDSQYKLYIEKDQIAYENGEWVNKTTEARYWPEDENMALDFIASNKPIGLGSPAGLKRFSIPFTINNDVTKQEDLLYAVAKKQTRATNAVSGINLNFRHALSQIVFNARNDNAKLKVEIKDITVAYVSNYADFEFNLNSEYGTDEQYVKNSMGVGNFYDVAKPLTVSVIKHEPAMTNYTADFEDVTILGEGTANLTNVDDKLAMLLIPQKYEDWTEAEKLNKTEYANVKKPYLIIDCNMYNIGAKHEIDGNGTADLVDEYIPVHTGKYYVPFNVEWESGVKYLYTLIFGIEDMIPTIKYNVTADDWFFAAAVENPVEVK